MRCSTVTPAATRARQPRGTWRRATARMFRAAARMAARTARGTVAAASRIFVRRNLDRAVERIELPRVAQQRAGRRRGARRRRSPPRGARSPRRARAQAPAAPAPPADCVDSTILDHCCQLPTPNYDDDLVERVFDDALAAGRLHLRDQVAHRALLDDRVDRHPVLVAQRRDRRPLQRRQQREDLVEIGRGGR